MVQVRLPAAVVMGLLHLALTFGAAYAGMRTQQAVQTQAIANNAAAIQEVRRDLKSHIEDQHVHITDREIQGLSDRLERIEALLVQQAQGGGLGH